MPLFAYVLTLLLPLVAHAQEPDWKRHLAADQVTIEADQMIYKSTQLCSIQGSGGRTVQLHAVATAPVSAGISRETFVATAASTEGMFIGILLTMLSAANADAAEKFNCKMVENLIGTPDMTTRVTMTADGLQVEWTMFKETHRTTMGWKEAFGG